MSSMGSLANMHAVVTGGGRGIGHAIALRLSELGASLTLLGRDADRLERAARALPRCDARACDVGDAEAVRDTFDAIARAAQSIAILVNNAGAARSAKFAATDDELWNAMLRVNLSGTFHCTRAALPAVLKAQHGRIVNIASTAGLTGYPYVTAYCAAKHGVVGLTRALALELANTQVTVNAVCPGYTDTDLLGEAVTNIVAKTGRSAADARSDLAARNPQRRLVTPEEVAATVAWLCLPASSAITGQAISISGGEVLN